METFLAFLVKICACFISLFLPIVNVFTPLVYSPLDPGSVQLNAVIIADTHIDDDETERQLTLRRGIANINMNSSPVDFLAVVGDCTENGTSVQYGIFFDILSGCKEGTLALAAVGNHDSWSEDESFNAYYEQYSEFLGRTIDKSYSLHEKNGYSIFLLGTQKKMSNEAFLDKDQLDWFDSQLASITDLDKPVLVMLHQPFNGTNRVDEAWKPGKLGDQSDALMSIVKKYTEQGMTVIFFSGHLHSGFGFSGVTNDGSLYFVDCPSYGKTPARGDVTQTGTGYVLEAYPDRVVIRARDFVEGYFSTPHTYTIPITSPVTE